MAQFIGIVLLVGLLAFFAFMAATGSVPGLREAWADRERHATTASRLWRSVKAGAGRHYLTVLILVGGILFLWVLAFYAWKLLPISAGLLDRMREPDATANAEATRNIAFAIAAFAGMLAVLATVPFRLVRAWIAERTARVAESNLITDLLNKAVEGLGAEKTVKRTVTREDGTTFVDERTAPNLEVRIGAILTLERIARDNAAEHVRVMDILCAYIRENAKARDAKATVWEFGRPNQKQIEMMLCEGGSRDWMAHVLIFRLH